MVNKMPIYRPPIQASKARTENQSKAYYLATIIASGFITMHKNRGESSYFFWPNSSEAGEASAKRSGNGGEAARERWNYNRERGISAPQITNERKKLFFL